MYRSHSESRIQLEAQGPSTTCNESKEEEEEDEFVGWMALAALLHFEPSLDALSLRSDVISSIQILSLHTYSRSKDSDSLTDVYQGGTDSVCIRLALVGR